MNAASVPQFPASVVSATKGRSILAPSPEFLAQCIATPKPWVALQDALQAHGITTHVTITPPEVDPHVDAPGDTWPERIRYRRQHCRTTYTLTIDDQAGHDLADWQKVMQWAALHQFQSLAGVKTADDANGVCFGSEHERYVIAVGCGSFDYALRDTYEPIMWKAWRAAQVHPTVTVFGEAIEPQDMDGILAEHLLAYAWQTPPISVVGYVTWPDGQIKGLYAAAINFYDKLMQPRNQSAMFPSGHWNSADGESEERVSALDSIAQGQHLDWPTVVPRPGDADLRDSIWKALHDAANDAIDDEIIRRRWLTRPQDAEPYKHIAKDLGISVQAVSKRWKRLRAAVRDVLPQPEKRARLAYQNGEHESLREGFDWAWQPETRDLGQLVDRAAEPEHFWQRRETDLGGVIRWGMDCTEGWLPGDEDLDAGMRAAGYAYGPSDTTVPMACGPIPRQAQWSGAKGVFSKLMDMTTSSDARNASDGMSGWSEGAGFWNPSGYLVPMRWRPGEASVAARQRLVSPAKAAKADENGEAVWNVGPSAALRQTGGYADQPKREWWTVTGLGRRGPDGPAGTDSAGFGSLTIEQGSPRRRADGRPLPAMPENVEEVD